MLFIAYIVLLKTKTHKKKGGDDVVLAVG